MRVILAILKIQASAAWEGGWKKKCEVNQPYAQESRSSGSGGEWGNDSVLPLKNGSELPIS